MSGGHLHVIHGGLGAGTNVKMVHQVLAGINIVMASEAMGFAAKMGLDTKNTSDELSKSEGSSWMFCNRGPHMVCFAIPVLCGNGTEILVVGG